MAGRYRNDEHLDLITRIKDLEARISKLERTPQIGSTALDKGAFVVKDDTGLVRVRMGLLSNGLDYGMETYEPSTGEYTASPTIATEFIDLPAESTTSIPYVDLATVGPSVTLTVRNTGRLVLLMGTYCFPAAPKNTSQAAAISAELSGANTLVASSNRVWGTFYWDTAPSAGTISMYWSDNITAVGMIEGLNPGPTTVTMKFKSLFGDNITFQNRSLIAIAL